MPLVHPSKPQFKKWNEDAQQTNIVTFIKGL